MVEQVFAAAPAFLPGNRVVAAPSQFVFTGSEALRLTVFRRSFGPTLDVEGRFRADADGVTRPFKQSIPNTAITDAGDVFEWQFPAGQLFNVRIGLVGSGVLYGLFYVRLQQIVGAGSAAIVLGTLLQGYLSSKSDLAWPGSPIASVHDGRGFLANASWTVTTGSTLQAAITPPTNLRYGIVAGRVDVASSPVAGARGVYLELLDAGGTVYFTSGCTTTLGPSETRAICFGSGIPARATSIGGVEWLDCPTDLELYDALSLRVLVSGFQAGDTMTARGSLVREWFND